MALNGQMVLCDSWHLPAAALLLFISFLLLTSPLLISSFTPSMYNSLFFFLNDSFHQCSRPKVWGRSVSTWRRETLCHFETVRQFEEYFLHFLDKWWGYVITWFDIELKLYFFGESLFLNSCCYVSVVMNRTALPGGMCGCWPELLSCCHSGLILADSVYFILPNSIPNTLSNSYTRAMISTNLKKNGIRLR